MVRWIVVGLGNPGKQYERSRHNAGFMVVDRIRKGVWGSWGNWGLEKKFSAECCEGGGVLLMKPQTFMNDSGKAVAQAVRFYKISLDHLIVIHDDLDIVMGQTKAGLTKGPKVHNGLDSIEQQLGSKDFWRVRVGVDDRTAEDRVRISPPDYVLKALSQDEMKILESGLSVAATKVTEIIEAA